MTRICKLKGFRGFIGGKDNDNVFDEGVVYEVRKIMGEILLTPIGTQPEFDGEEKIENLCLEEIIVRGRYLLPTNKY